MGNRFLGLDEYPLAAGGTRDAEETDADTAEFKRIA
jgi:hypothetical protein